MVALQFYHDQQWILANQFENTLSFGLNSSPGVENQETLWFGFVNLDFGLNSLSFVVTLKGLLSANFTDHKLYIDHSAHGLGPLKCPIYDITDLIMGQN